MLATGRGEYLSSLPTLDDSYVVLGKHRSLSVSTAWAYQTYRHQFLSSKTKSQSEAQQVVDAVRTAIPDPDLDLWVSQFTNSSIRVKSIDN